MSPTNPQEKGAAQEAALTLGDRFPCPQCKRLFKGRDGAFRHAKTKHAKTWRQFWRGRNPDDDEESMASRMIDAQLQRVMGGPVEDEWLLDALP